MNPRALVLQENRKGRDFVIGDIHGAFDLLDKALLTVKFDPEKDRLIALGDLIDRGPQSADCLYYLSRPWFHSILGNHEKMFMRLYQDGKLDIDGVVENIPNGMAWMLEADMETLSYMRSAFEKLPLIMEIESADGPICFVHADIPANMDWPTFRKKIEEHDEAAEKTAMWKRTRIKTNDNTNVDGAARIFLGHTPVEGGPRVLGNCFFIDTGAVFKLIDKNNQQDLYMTLADIKASVKDILSPAATSESLIRVALVRESPVIQPRPKRAKPPAP